MEKHFADVVTGERERERKGTQESPRVSGILRFQWPNSAWSNLAAACILGCLYALYAMGPAPLNPKNISWLHGDPATYYTGWAIFRQDPNFHWPLTFTHRIGYPIGDSVALMDLNPLLAILLKPFSPLLPDSFQYLGLEFLLACILQMYFALKLFRLLLGSNPLAVVLPSLFFLVSPIMTFRVIGHFTLTNHWLLTAALFVFCLGNCGPSPVSQKRFVAMALVLAATAVATNPYLSFQVFLILLAAVLGLLWRRHLTLLATAGVLIALTTASAAAAYMIGFIIPGGQGYTLGGYRFYSMNLLSPVDPETFGSVVFRALPHFTGGQYEGYAYLGAGVVLLAAAAVVAVTIRWRNIFSLLLAWRPGIPLVLCCLLLTLMALSTQISIGSKLLVDFDPGQKLSPYLGALRSSGRLFWTPYYVLLIAVLVVPYLSLRRRWANLLLGVALLVQVADERPLVKLVHSAANRPFESPLKSPIWFKLGSAYQNLVIMPPYQCGPEASPGGRDNDAIFGIFAASQKMRINSYNSGRFTGTNLKFHCGESVYNLIHQPLSAASVYVVTPELATAIAGSGLGKCHNVDSFVLCSAADDFGLSPAVWESRNQFWIRNRFKWILLRDPSASEVTKWTKALDRDSAARLELINELLTSGEFEHRSLPRLWAYIDAHGKWPTRTEWLKADSQSPIVGSDSPNGKLIPHDRNLALLYMLYFAVLERDPDPIGLSVWAGPLASNGLAFTAAQFLGSPEYKVRGL